MSNASLPLTYLSKAKADSQQAKILLEAGFPDGTANRAYYALFNCILALLNTAGGLVPKTHTGAHTEFRKLFIKTGIFDESMSNAITELFNLRQGGDYEIDFDISVEDAQSAIDRAAEFLLQTEAYLRSQGYSQ